MTRTARQTVDAAMSEDDLLTAIVEAALLYGWRIYHPRRSDLGNPQWGTHPGFPDLVMSRKGVTIVAELKAAKEQPTTEQFAWLQAMGHSAGLDSFQEGPLRVFIWRPEDLDYALTVLR